MRGYDFDLKESSWFPFLIKKSRSYFRKNGVWSVILNLDSGVESRLFLKSNLSFLIVLYDIGLLDFELVTDNMPLIGVYGINVTGYKGRAIFFLIFNLLSSSYDHFVMS